ncbi:MAG TPA: hypothetical protein VLM76_11280 [Patescibacteria group bacterium]|nr:hypothetical protein [Patescibacteria group bacterium]
MTVVVPLLAESNWSNRQIAAVAGVSHTLVNEIATGSDLPVPRPAETLGADGMSEFWPRVAESETEFERRRKTAFKARERRNDASRFDTPRPAR